MEILVNPLNIVTSYVPNLPRVAVCGDPGITGRTAGTAEGSGARVCALILKTFNKMNAMVMIKFFMIKTRIGLNLDLD